MGDVLFSLVNVSRYIEADPEIQLKKSTERFINRAKYVESNKDDNSDIEKLWLEAKKDEIDRKISVSLFLDYSYEYKYNKIHARYILD